MDPESIKSNLETDPLIKLRDQYDDYVTFISISPERTSKEAQEALNKIPWEKFVIEENNPIIKRFKVSTYPYYILLDPTGYVVAAPALGPMPNGDLP
jgi:hypothetical protein